jgi:hypothetical protein
MTTTTNTTPLVVGESTRLARGCIAVLRIGVALMWIQNASWKTPPDFGETDKSGLYVFTRYAVEHPVLPPFAALIDQVVLPNFVFFRLGRAAHRERVGSLPAGRSPHPVLGGGGSRAVPGDHVLGAERTPRVALVLLLDDPGSPRDLRYGRWPRVRCGRRAPARLGGVARVGPADC